MAAFMGGSGSSTMWNNDMVYKTYDSDQEIDDGKGGKKLVKKGQFVRDENGNKIVDKWTQEDADTAWTQADVDNGLCKQADVGKFKCKQSMVGTDKVAAYNASGKMLRHINKIAGSDRMLSTQLLAMARANQSRAGREDTGGGGFSDTAIEMDQLWRAQTGEIEYTLEDATKGVTKSLIKGKNVYEIFRSGKPKVAQAVAPVLAEMTEEELQIGASTAQREVDDAQATYNREVQAARIELQTANDTIVSAPERIARVQEINARIEQLEQVRVRTIDTARQQEEGVALRAIAREQMFHSVAATSSADVAQTMGNQLYNTQFNMDLLPEQIRQHVIQKSGKARPTHLEVFESLRDHPVWGAYVKEYGRGPVPRLDPNDPNVQAEAERVGMEVNAYIARFEAAARERAEREGPAGDPRAR